MGSGKGFVVVDPFDQGVVKFKGPFAAIGVVETA